MSLQKIVSSAFLTSAQCRSLAPATADVIASLAGRTRYLYELATGVAAHTDGPATPANPQGMLGVDRSGPPWGDAFQHPLWYVEGAQSSAGFYGEKPVVSLTTIDQVERIRAAIWVRPHQTGALVPYSRGYFVCQGVRTSASVNGVCTIKVFSDSSTSQATNSTTLTCTSQTVLTTSTEIFTNLVPGLNLRTIEFRQTSTSGLTIHAAAINQIVRRSH